MSKCSQVVPGEVKKLLDAHFKKKENVNAAMLVDADQFGERNDVAKTNAWVSASAETRSIVCSVGGLATQAMFDSGADQSLACPTLLARLEKAGCWLAVRQLKQEVDLGGFQEGLRVKISQEVKLDLTFATYAGDLVLRNVICWVAAKPLAKGLGDVLVSRPVMAKMGYSTADLLGSACERQPEYDMVDVDAGGSPVIAMLQRLDPERKVDMTPEEENLHPWEETVCFPDAVEDNATLVEKKILEKVAECLAAGCSLKYADGLKQLLTKFADVFRLKLGRDPPVQMPPLIVNVRPDAIPVRCKARRYSVEQRQFMKKHVAELVQAGLVYRNPRSRWSSPPLIVKKPEANEFRMTVDVRAVNAQTERMVWPMPMLEVILDHVAGASLFFSLDFFKGYWQFMLDKDSQELFSFLTDEGVYTPTRVLMGGSDSVAYCQSTVQDMFAEFLYQGLLIWLDDLLGYEKTEDGLLDLLRRILEVCAQKGLKLNPKKCSFYKQEAKWCGRIISREGVFHDPERIKALQDLPAPQTGKDLQQFVCALNWMRQSIPGYNKQVQPLMEFMERVYKSAAGRTKQKVAKVNLVEIGWSELENGCLERCKVMLGDAVTLAHQDPKKLTCVFTDASEGHWGAVVTQISPEAESLVLEDQDHEPLMFLSGSFSGAASRWAIVEKEAFAIVETFNRADYLLHRPGGFALFTDHANLKFIFDPASVNASIPKYTAAKLDRWALLLMGYEYRIHSITGESNVWADLLSRWGRLKSVCALMNVPMVSPMQEKDFDWPSMDEIKEAQRDSRKKQELWWNESTKDMCRQWAGVTEDSEGYWRTESGALWIPAGVPDLKIRLCVVAHYGLGGHRGVESTLLCLKKHFEWHHMKSDVQRFVGQCLHCMGAAGRVKRPYGEALHATKPNELIHWDYLSMGDGYLLVVKDDASNFLTLYEAERADAATTARCLMAWFAIHGVCYEWTSDQGSHFKNEVIAELRHVLGAKHHFTAARCPWANGTIENAMKHVLKAFRVLLSEWRMDKKDWRMIKDVVQMICNHAPAPSLGGLSPFTAMMGREAMSPLALIKIPGPRKSTTMAEVLKKRGKEVQAMRDALESTHAYVAQSKSKKRAASKARHNASARIGRFEVGDFVLYMDVYQASHKLQGQWKGPAQIVKVSSDWLYDVQHLLTAQVREIHASRLQFYADSTLAVTEQLKDHVAHNDQGFLVEDFSACRWNADVKRFEIQVKWRGLSEAEMTWEPATNLMEDLPTQVSKYLSKNRKDATILRMIKAHGWQVDDETDSDEVPELVDIDWDTVPRKGGSVAPGAGLNIPGGMTVGQLDMPVGPPVRPSA